MHEPLHRVGLAPLRKFLDQRGGVPDVAGLVDPQAVVQKGQATPPLGRAVCQQHWPLNDVVHQRADLGDVHLDEIVERDRARVRRARVGLERASLRVAGGQRNKLGTGLVVDDVRESEIQHRDIGFGVSGLVDRVRLDLGGHLGIRCGGREVPQVPGAFAFPLRILDERQRHPVRVPGHVAVDLFVVLGPKRRRCLAAGGDQRVAIIRSRCSAVRAKGFQGELGGDVHKLALIARTSSPGGLPISS